MRGPCPGTAANAIGRSSGSDDHETGFDTVLLEQPGGGSGETIFKASVLETVGASRISIGAGEDRSSLPARREADFAVLSLLGEGGMGRVLLARQRSLARDVALKTLKPFAAADASAALLREARITGALEHPGVVPVHALALDEGGRPMLVMKRVDGVDLETLLANEAHPAWRASGRSEDRLVASLEIMVQVCLTLEFAHSRGIVHRDVKPKNIMVGSFGEVYLLDWGIAAEINGVNPGDLVGTPASIPPEMALGQPFDQRTDVYLVGATLHEILTGGPRHRGDTVDELLRAAVLSEPFAYPESLPMELASLCNRATSRSPSARPASVTELREAISGFIRSRSSRALNDAALERLVELEALLSSPGPPQDLARAYRLVTEARFGFALNLREHKSDPVARSGMRRCLALAIELELRQDHAESAEALLREMDDADPKLAKRVEEVRDRASAYARKRHRLELLDHELDPTQHSWKRGIFLAGFCLVGVVVGRTITLGGVLSPERVAVGSVVTTVLFGTGLFALRHRVWWNVFNKQLIALAVLGMMIVVGHRLIAVVYRTPVHETMTIDLVIACGLAFYAAYAFVPRLVLCAVPALVGILAALAWPLHAPFICVASLAIGAVVAAVTLMQVKKPGGS